MDAYRSTGAITIYGGSIKASSHNGGAAIGGGKNGSKHIVNITGGYVIAASSSYESSSEMMEMVTRYLDHAPMGSQYQRTANAMMVSVAGLVDLFSGDEELSGAGIGGGHGGSGGEVNIFGGIVTAKSGLSSANAIGKGKGGSNSGTLELGHDMMVSAGSDDNNAQLQTKDNRLNVCRNCKFAEVRPCGFSHTNYTIVDEYCHRTSCEYCAVDQDLGLHEFDASGLSCTLCGYQRIKVSFDPGEGSGVMEDVYLAKGETFTLPANAFTPPDDQYFSGWRGTIGSVTDVFVPGASFRLNESLTLTAEHGDTYQLWVGGKQVTDANKNDVLGDGKVSFDPENSVLNLNGVTSLPGINSNQRSLIYANRMNLTITGCGELTPSQMFSNGVHVNIGSLTLNGDFSVVGSQGNAFFASKDIIIAGGTVTATGGLSAAGIGAGIDSYSEVVISGGTVNAAGGTYSSGIGGNSSTITLTYTDDVSITTDSYGGTVTLEKRFTDGATVFDAGVVSDKSTLQGTTLTPFEGTGVRLIGHSISLDGDIGVNFYIELSDDIIAHQDTAYVRFTGGTSEQTMLVSDAKIKTQNNRNYYVFKCSVTAKEMTSKIKAQLIDGEKIGAEYTYSVKEYADYLLEHADEREDLAKAVPLVKAMLNYGARTQIYFDKNPADLANVSLSEEEKALGEVTVTAPESAIDLPDGVSFEGATLSLKSETTLSLYFESAKTLTFECEGKNVETVTSGKYQIARIRGIKAKELKKTFTLTVKDGEEIIGTITYSPMTYCSNVLSDGTQSEALQNVCKALYLYAKAADSYFPD